MYTSLLYILNHVTIKLTCSRSKVFQLFLGVRLLGDIKRV